MDLMKSSLVTTLTKNYSNPVVVDVETSTYLKGHPFSTRNTMEMAVVTTLDNKSQVFTPQTWTRLRYALEKSDLWITFNGKFDLHWIRRELGITPKSVWDCQLAEFLLSNQRWRYPSLDEACAKRELPRKMDVVKHEYWEKGIDTKDIPYEVLRDYVIQDGESTLALFADQVKDFEGQHASKYKLFRVQCNDLLVLQEMEYNGILYDVEGSLAEADKLTQEVAAIDSKMTQIGKLSFPFNFDSPQQISKLLYGGIVKEEFSAPIGVFKTGLRKGEVKMKKFEREHVLERLVEPLAGTEMAAEGIWSINEDTLGKLAARGPAKALIKLYQERVKLQKLNSTYLTGLPKRIKEMDWDDNIIHSNLNQCVVVSGRLASNKPNVQNQPAQAKQFCISRFKT